MNAVAIEQAITELSEMTQSFTLTLNSLIILDAS